MRVEHEAYITDLMSPPLSPTHETVVEDAPGVDLPTAPSSDTFPILGISSLRSAQRLNSNSNPNSNPFVPVRPKHHPPNRPKERIPTRGPYSPYTLRRLLSVRPMDLWYRPEREHSQRRRIFRLRRRFGRCPTSKASADGQSCADGKVLRPFELF